MPCTLVAPEFGYWRTTDGRTLSLSMTAVLKVLAKSAIGLLLRSLTWLVINTDIAAPDGQVPRNVTVLLSNERLTLGVITPPSW